MRCSDDYMGLQVCFAELHMLQLWIILTGAWIGAPCLNAGACVNVSTDLILEVMYLTLQKSFFLL